MYQQVLILKVFSEKDSLTVLVSELCPIEGEGPLGVTEGLRKQRSHSCTVSGHSFS